MSIVAFDEDQLGREVVAVKERIKRLKDKYARRQRLANGEPEKMEAVNSEAAATEAKPEKDQEANTQALQQLIARILVDPNTTIPLDSAALHRKLSQPQHALQYEEALRSAAVSTIDPVLREMAGGTSPCLEAEDFRSLGKTRVMILDANRQRLLRIAGFQDSAPAEPSARGPPPGEPPRGPGPPEAMGMPPAGMMPPFMPGPMMGMPGMMPMGPHGMGLPGMPMGGPRGAPMPPPGEPPGGARGGTDLDALLNRQSTRDRKKTEKGEELLDLIQKPTAKEAATVNQFRSEGGPVVREYCPHLTKLDCCRIRGSMFPCKRVHFQRLIFPWTDPSLGNCSYLDTCRHMKICKHIHYQLDDNNDEPVPGAETALIKSNKPAVPKYLEALPEPQWLKIDVRTFDMTVLGKFGVIMADPPWEIHQDLPYGTMADDEMRRMNIGVLQDDGVIFLWVTGRAMELGRECLDIWGYKRVDELIWVKVNQLQRLIRTGRTGHWLNHSKEHCLVGIKGNPNLNRNVDCDVVVGEVRETSRKPDEMYPLLERLSPGTRKLEIFARQHNVKPGWVCLGNQLAGINIKEPDMQARFDATYPNGLD